MTHANFINANSLSIPLANESVQCVVTSPPYYGLRDYGTARWEGGEEGCEHVQIKRASLDSGLRNDGRKHKGLYEGEKATKIEIAYRDTCRKCGAIRVDNQIGLEPTLEEYVANMVAVFREVWRVLRKDGVCWLNLGDSYNGSGGAGGDYNPGGLKEGQPRYPGHNASNLKPKDLVGIPWRVAFALQADGWYLRSDIIWAKCLSGGTRLYAKTQKGEMPTTVKDLVRLDPSTVKLWTGEKWSQVLSWMETPRPDDSIEIILRSGERIGCTRNHIWPTQRGNLRADELIIGDIVQTCRLPEPENARTPDLLPDEVGRFVGLYIAEGSQSDGTIQISGHADDDARWQWLSGFVARFDGYAAKHNTGGKSCSININSPVLLGILNAYVNGHTAHDKHLHPRCWARGNTFLQSLLDGYLAGDGHWTGERWRLGFCDNDNLAADLRTLCARIGLSLRLKRTKHTMGGRLFDGWRGEIRLQHRNDGGEIISIGKSRARKFWDIAIADAPHLFALASGVLTHNSNPMPESVTDRPTKAHEYVFLLAKSQKYYYDNEAVRENFADERHGIDGAKIGRVRNVGGRTDGYTTPNGWNNPFGNAGRNLRTVWTIATQPYKGAHFATYPEKLVEPCIKAGTSERGCCPKCGKAWVRVVEHDTEYDHVTTADGKSKIGPYASQTGSGLGTHDVRHGVYIHTNTLGWRSACTCDAGEPIPCTVLDPFAGSGTTGVVCQKLGRRFVGLDLSPEYLNLARERCGLDKLARWTTTTPPPAPPQNAPKRGERTNGQMRLEDL